MDMIPTMGYAYNIANNRIVGVYIGLLCMMMRMFVGHASAPQDLGQDHQDRRNLRDPILFHAHMI